MNIAMWSGPRNLSTAMMYAFAARPDTDVWDEPFYAPYLAATGVDHPMADEIVIQHESDAQVVACRCAADAPSGAPIFYQKHMAQHMLATFDLSFMASVTNVFLIRHPAAVIASYHRKRQNPTAEDIGAHSLIRLFERAAQIEGSAPIVLDSGDVRRAPRAALRALCKALAIRFTDAMMTWPAGGNKADGVWAPHWYGAVHQSTGFAAGDDVIPQVPDHLHDVLKAALPPYEAMRAHTLVIASAAGTVGERQAQ